jgi:anaerobic magnesium-protoporphyrin IX monomethyl ester cyclase
MSGPEVVLINPKMCRPSGIRLPLSVLSLGAVLEGKYSYQIIDGNVNPTAVSDAVAATGAGKCRAVGLTVMPGPQVAPAIETSAAIRAANPTIPIIWGGYFPTLYHDAAINAHYVDYVVRGEGEGAFLDLLERLPEADAASLREVRGLTWKHRGQVVHNPNSDFRPPNDYPVLPYERVGDVRRYLRPSFMGSRTAVHQAAVGCRYHCTFCGVVSMFNGYTALSSEQRLEQSLLRLRDGFGANAIQFYDHNFFDNERSSIPSIEVLAGLKMPWWCYARADTLAKFSSATWDLLRKSRFTMAYIGAEAASDEVLKRMRKGSKVEHTFEVARRCREYGVIPEFSFVLGGPEDPEADPPPVRSGALLLQPDAAARSGLSPRCGASGGPACPEFLRASGAGAAVDAGGMDPAAVAQLRLPSGRALAVAPNQTACQGLRRGAGLPVPHRPGLRDAPVGQEGPRRPRQLALQNRNLPESDGTTRGPQIHSPAAATGRKLVVS